MELYNVSFLLFLLITYLSFYISSPNYKWIVLLIASYLFCTFYSPETSLVLFLISSLNFMAGTLIFRNRHDDIRQRRILYSFVAMNILLLTILKYLGFISTNINALLDVIKTGQISIVHIMVPVGISYFTLKGIGYLVDIYWDKIENEKHFGHFLLYMSFFPQFKMGPVERPGTLLPQIKKLGSFKFDYYNMKSGCLLFLWGLLQKVVIADNLSVLVNEVYGNADRHSGLSLIIATLFFAFQLYYDFSGYTNMALGVGRLFNIQLTRNFDHPFFAANIQEFWRKWHMSFSYWIRDYIFVPLSAKYRSLKKTGICLSLVVTFILVGLWHGAMWTYILFGLAHGIFLSVSVSTSEVRDEFWKRRGQLNKKWLLYTRRLVTFSMVCFTMIFFRADSVGDAFLIIGNIFHPDMSYFNISPGLEMLKYSACLVLFGELVHLMQRAGKIKPLFFETPAWVRWPVYYAAVLAIFYLGELVTEQRFIYAQF